MESQLVEEHAFSIWQTGQRQHIMTFSNSIYSAICHHNALVSPVPREESQFLPSNNCVITIYSNDSKRCMRYIFLNLNIPHLRPLCFLSDARTEANPFLESAPATTFNEHLHHLLWWTSAIFSVNNVRESKQGKKVCDETWIFHLKFIKKRLKYEEK